MFQCNVSIIIVMSCQFCALKTVFLHYDKHYPYCKVSVSKGQEAKDFLMFLCPENFESCETNWTMFNIQSVENSIALVWFDVKKTK